MEDKKVRHSVIAGSWYPGTAEALSEEIDRLARDARWQIPAGKVRALLVPHAGYMYSGRIAAAAFNAISGRYRDVILLGPSHRYPLNGVAFDNHKYYSTPLGRVKCSERVADFVSTLPEAEYVDQAFSDEHALEIEIPFLQKKLDDWLLIPMLVGQTDPNDLAQALDKEIGDDDLLVISVDLSHFHTDSVARQLDKSAIDCIASLDAEGILSAEIDAPWAVSSLLSLAKIRGWTPHLAAKGNSSTVSGDTSSVVGYASFIFTE